MLATQGPKPLQGLVARTSSLKLLDHENLHSSPSRTSAPVAFSILASDLRQLQQHPHYLSTGPVQSGPRSSVDRSSRLLPLRQTILAASPYDAGAYQPHVADAPEDFHVSSFVGGASSSEHVVASAIDYCGGNGNGNWAASGLLLRGPHVHSSIIPEGVREGEQPGPSHAQLPDGCEGGGGCAAGDLGPGPNQQLLQQHQHQQHQQPCAGSAPPSPPRPPSSFSQGGGGGRRRRQRRVEQQGQGCVGMWADFWQQLRQQQKVLREVTARKWWIPVVPLLLCGLLCGLGVFGVVYAAFRYEEQLRDYARGALASTAISTVASQLEIATFAVMTLSAYLTQQPNCSQLSVNYNNLSEVIFQWDAKQSVYQLQAMPAAVVQYIHPYPDPDLAAQLIGRDILRLSQYRNDTLQQIRERGKRLLLGPYNLLEGFQAMFVTFAVFLPAPDPLYDWGCGVQPHECPPGTCWFLDEQTGSYQKLWGMATSLVRLDALKEGFGFGSYEEQGYSFRLWQQRDDINREAVIDASATPPHDPVVLTLEKYNLRWVFEVAPSGGWAPAWRNPCIAAVMAGSVLVSGLVLWLLLTREKHNLLLRAMLPRKVIRQLQRGAQTVVEEYLDPVTILFTDIVSYTEVASHLTPLQVVRLLNELYTEFDALTDKHGVYKVETIGDAFMCVSGCPLREDPVAAAVRMAGVALDMIALVGRFVSRVAGEEMQVQIRIGLHSGPVVAGVIGQRMPRYCLFGDTVNTASRMESNSAPMCINVSSATAELLRAGGAIMVPYVGGPTTPLLLQPPSAVPSPSGGGACAAPFSTPPSPTSYGRPFPSQSGVAFDIIGAPSPLPRTAPLPATAQRRSVSASRGLQQQLLQQQLLQQNQEQQLQQQQPLPGATGIISHLSGAGLAAMRSALGGSISPPALVLHSRGTVLVKGKGPMNCYWLGPPPHDFAD